MSIHLQELRFLSESGRGRARYAVGFGPLSQRQLRMLPVGRERVSSIVAKRLALPEHAKAVDFSRSNPSQCCVIAPSDTAQPNRLRLLPKSN